MTKRSIINYFTTHCILRRYSKRKYILALLKTILMRLRSLVLSRVFIQGHNYKKIGALKSRPSSKKLQVIILTFQTLRQAKKFLLYRQPPLSRVAEVLTVVLNSLMAFPKPGN